MNYKQIKKTLIDRDLTISKIAEEVAPELGLAHRSCVQMLSDLTYGRRWYPTLAAKVYERFGIAFKRPDAYAPKVRIRKAA